MLVYGGYNNDIWYALNSITPKLPLPDSSAAESFPLPPVTKVQLREQTVLTAEEP